MPVSRLPGPIVKLLPIAVFRRVIVLRLLPCLRTRLPLRYGLRMRMRLLSWRRGRMWRGDVRSLGMRLSAVLPAKGCVRRKCHCKRAGYRHKSAGHPLLAVRRPLLFMCSHRNCFQGLLVDLYTAGLPIGNLVASAQVFILLLVLTDRWTKYHYRPDRSDPESSTAETPVHCHPATSNPQP